MVLTVTINPLLERRMKFNKVTLGAENRNGVVELKTGGKGINVSRQLTKLDIDTVAFCLLGGENGKTIKELLFKENIKNTSVRTKTETRDNFIIYDEASDMLTTYFGQNNLVDEQEVEEFKTKLDKIIQNCEIVVFSGSSPSPAADSIFPYGIELANKYDKISICDTYGEHLNACLDKAPTIVHNNVDEIKNSLGLKIDTREDKINYIHSLYNKGIKQAYITDGSNETIAATFDFIYSVRGQKLEHVADSTGSGDAFTAGIVYGLDKDFTFEQTVILACKLGAANAKSFEACNVQQSELDSFNYSVEVSSIGKKMKILDVTPTHK